MATFAFSAVTYQNTITSGTFEAKNLKVAKEIVLARYAYPITLRKKIPAAFDFLFKEAGTTTMNTADVSLFLLLLGEMLKAGISINEALMDLARTGDKSSAKLAKSLHLRLIEGDDLSQAFTHCSKLVGGNYGPYIKIGVEGGSVGTVLINLSEHIKKGQQALKRITSAMSYPLMMVILTFVISIFLFTQTVPQIVDSVMSMMDTAQLPRMTQIAIAISNFMVNDGPRILVVLLIAAAVLVFLLRKPFNYQWHQFQVAVPYVGQLIINRDIGTFFSSMAIAIGAGMPMAEAMRTASGGVSNKHIRASLITAANEVEHNGKSITEALLECPFVKGIEIPIIDVGAKSSQFPKMGNVVAEIKDLQNEQKIRNVSTFINPIMLVIIGSLVGCIMYAVYGPIFSLMQNMGAG